MRSSLNAVTSERRVRVSSDIMTTLSESGQPGVGFSLRCRVTFIVYQNAEQRLAEQRTAMMRFASMDGI